MGAVKRSLDTSRCRECNHERWQCACPVEQAPACPHCGLTISDAAKLACATCAT